MLLLRFITTKIILLLRRTTIPLQVQRVSH